MANEELKLELQARAYREVHGISWPGDSGPLQAQQQPAQQQAPAPPPVPQLSFQDAMLIAEAQKIRQRNQQAGFVQGRQALSPAMNAILDALEPQAAAAAAPPAQAMPATPRVPRPSQTEAQDNIFRGILAQREQLAKQPKPLVPGYGGGFLSRPVRPKPGE